MQRFGSIYLVTNLVNGKQYVGQTTMTVGRRWSVHKAVALSGKEDHLFMRAINKHGPEAFRVAEIAVAFDRAGLDAAEDVCIAQFDSLAPNGYNLKVGEGGRNHSEETKAKIRAHRHSDETRQKMSESQSRRYQDPAMRAAQGRVQLDAERQKRSETMKRIGHTVKHTPESIAKMAASKRGKPSGKAKPIVDQYGTVYRSMTEAAEKIGCPVSNVSLVVNGKQKQTKGFILTYLSKD